MYTFDASAFQSPLLKNQANGNGEHSTAKMEVTPRRDSQSDYGFLEEFYDFALPPNTIERNRSKPSDYDDSKTELKSTGSGGIILFRTQPSKEMEKRNDLSKGRVMDLLEEFEARDDRNTDLNKEACMKSSKVVMAPSSSFPLSAKQVAEACATNREVEKNVDQSQGRQKKEIEKKRKLQERKAKKKSKRHSLSRAPLRQKQVTDSSTYDPTINAFGVVKKAIQGISKVPNMSSTKNSHGAFYRASNGRLYDVPNFC
jgi:hypothetical protein